MWGYEKEETHNFAMSQMEKIIRGNGFPVVSIGWKTFGQSWLFGRFGDLITLCTNEELQVGSISGIQLEVEGKDTICKWILWQLGIPVLNSSGEHAD